MKRAVETWTIEDLEKERSRLTFPDYQRQGNLWSKEKKGLLIDSVLRDIDIPKLYLNEIPGGSLEVVDGQQRIWSFLDFLDGELAYPVAGRSIRFGDLSAAQKRTVKSFELQITKFDNADDDYLRELFLRLQFGVLLITGEKLHAAKGELKDFIFQKMAKEGFVRKVNIPPRRYAKEALCSQIAINMFSIHKTGSFSRTRAEDLLALYLEYEKPVGPDLTIFKTVTRRLLDVTRSLDDCFGAKGSELKNRSYVLSLFFLYEALDRQNKLAAQNARKTFVEFSLSLWKKLKEEAKRGIDRQNRELYSFENLVSSAPGERYQIERRHECLTKYFEDFIRRGKLPGE